MRRDNKRRVIYSICFVIALLGLVILLNNSKIGVQTRIYIGELWVSNVNFVSNILTSIKETGNNVINRQSCRLENVLLQTKIQFIEIELLEMQRTALEMEKLKKQLNYQSSYKQNIITTKLFAISNNNFVKEAYIEAGSRQGINVGQSVLFENFLIGRVAEIYNNTSKILLIFDSRSKISAITSNSRNNIVIEGQNNNALLVKYLPETANIVNNETVVTSNYGTLYPRGIEIGKIIKQHDRYHINMPYKLEDIDLVRVINTNLRLKS